jgi:O-antigen/teichoic acid export membrane protein
MADQRDAEQAAAVTSVPGRSSAWRAWRGVATDSTALVAGTALSGVFAYVFFALATRALGAEDAAPVAQLWTYWSASAAVLTFPVQHWIIRTMHAPGGLAAVRGALPRVTALAIGAAAVVGLVSWLARVPLFARDDVVFPLLAVGVTVGAHVVGVVRGRLAGAERFVATGVAIAGENVLRVVLAVAVVAGGGGATGVGLALTAGALAVLAWPSAFRFPEGVADADAGSPLAFLGGVAAGSLIAQLVLTGGPVVLAAVGGAAGEITALFTTLAVFRAPYVLALGLVTRITGTLTDLVVRGRHQRLRRIRRLLVGGGAGGAVAAAAFGATVGPAAIDLVFGAGIAPPPAVVAIIAAATAVGLANLVFTVLLVARGASRALTSTWVAAVVAAAAAVAVLPVPPLPLVTWAFLTAEVVALGLLWWADVRAAAAAGQGA